MQLGAFRTPFPQFGEDGAGDSLKYRIVSRCGKLGVNHSWDWGRGQPVNLHGTVSGSIQVCVVLD